jgi:hypothetical protein
VDPCTEIRRRGWTQGSVLSAASAEEFRAAGDSLPEDFADFVVISHPCDVVAKDFEREPNVEMLARRVADTRDGNLSYGKNPRCWQMETDGILYEAEIRNRFLIPRQRLATADPAGNVTESDLRTLRRWLSNRYARAAFPDAFNDRFRPASAAVAKVLKRLGTKISGIYLLVDARELPEDEDYAVVLVATMLEDDFGDAEARRICSEAVTLVGASLDGCRGISLLESDMRSESQMSLSDLRELKRWDYDSLSLRDEGSPLAPDGE